METRLESELRKKLISECLKWEVELKRLLKELRVKKTKNSIIRRHNKVLDNEIVVLRRQSEEDSYKNAIEIKECKVVLKGDEICQENQLETTEQQTINQQANQQAIFLKYQFECRHPGCGKKFTRKQNLNLHMIGHTNKHQCQNCRRCFNSKYHLQGHFCKDIGEWPFGCDLEGCGKRFKSKSSLKYHIKKTHSNDRPFYCNQEGCGRFFKLKKSLETHLQDHLVFRPFQCQLQGCGKRFKTTAHFTNHLKKHKRVLNDNEFVMIEKLSLKVSKKDKKVVGVDEFQVVIVDQERIQNNNLNKAIVFKCQHPGCERTFNNRMNYYYHKNLHAKKYQCQHCQKCIRSITDLKSHLRFHTGEQPFKCDCDGCGERFKFKKILDNHKKTKHTDERPFECPENGCNKSFKIKWHLKQHLKHHSTDRSFQCPKEGCDKRFKTKTNLTHHVNNFHSNVRKFQCDFENCQKSFKTRSNLKQHQRTHKYYCGIFQNLFN